MLKLSNVNLTQHASMLAWPFRQPRHCSAAQHALYEIVSECCIGKFYISFEEICMYEILELTQCLTLSRFPLSRLSLSFLQVLRNVEFIPMQNCHCDHRDFDGDKHAACTVASPPYRYKILWLMLDNCSLVLFSCVDKSERCTESQGCRFDSCQKAYSCIFSQLLLVRSNKLYRIST